MESRHYPPSIIDRICELLEEGKSMREICAIDGLPSSDTIYRWLRGDDELSISRTLRLCGQPREHRLLRHFAHVRQETLVERTLRNIQVVQRCARFFKNA